MKNIATISGGLTSAFTAKLAIMESPETELVFTDTGWEDKDLYRFLDDLEKIFCKQIIRLKHPKYNNPEDLFIKQGILGNDRVPLCSRVLKVEVLQKYIKEKYNNIATVFFGIDYSEKHRAERIKFQYDKIGVKTRFPLVEKKDFFIRDKIESWLQSENVKIPRMYEAGYLHNNCSGGCVRQGKKSWLHLLKNNGTVYAERERLENSFKNGEFTFMKELSLKELREDQEKHCNLFEVDLTPCMCFEV